MILTTLQASITADKASNVMILQYEKEIFSSDKLTCLKHHLILMQSDLNPRGRRKLLIVLTLKGLGGEGNTISMQMEARNS